MTFLSQDTNGCVNIELAQLAEQEICKPKRLNLQKDLLTENRYQNSQHKIIKLDCHMKSKQILQDANLPLEDPTAAKQPCKHNCIQHQP